MDPSIFAAYHAAGWAMCRVEQQQKRPIYRGWQDAGIDECPPDGWACGLLHAYSGTMALDIDDVPKARVWLAERSIDLDQLLDAPDAVTVESGTPGHAKLIYRIPLPLPSKKVCANGTQNILDFRCATADGKSVQDVLPPAVHPSKREYAWGGKGDWRSLPEIPQPLIDIWLELLSISDVRSIPVPNAAPTSLAEITDALAHCDPDMDRQSWITVGMGLHEQLGEAGFSIWDEWSSKGTKYHANEMHSQWRSFHEHPHGITIASLFHVASKYGWRRPPPDVSDLFSPLPEQPDVEEIVEDLSITTRLPTVDVNLWPPVLANRALELADEVGCDPIVPLMAGLGALSAAVDTRAQLQITGSWRVPPTWWGMTIGQPADKKTPGSKPMFKVLRQIEREDHDRYAAELLVWQGVEARHAADLKAYREWQATPEAQMPGAVPPVVTTLPNPPSPLRLLIQDATTQKVVGMATGSPKGFLLYLDEMQKWLSRLSDSRSTDDRGCWIQGYEAGPYSMDRVGSGTVHVENLALSLYGNCQPDVFRKSILTASSDGILQRFVPVVLNPKYNRMWRESQGQSQAEKEYDDLVRRAHAMPAFEYHLGEQSMRLFRLFCAWSLKLRDHERVISSSMVYQTALGKLDGNCARLILLFHLILDPYTPEIPVETVNRVVQLFKKYFVPSIRYTYLEVGRQSDPSARIIFDMVVQWSGSRPVISISDIRAKLKNEDIGDRDSWKTDQLIRSVMDDMTARGYVAMHQDHPRHPVWSINSAVAEVFANHRKGIIAAKKGLSDMLKDIVHGHGESPKFREVIGYEDSN